MKNRNVALIGLVTIVSLTGCAGVELGGKLGLYRVDRRNEKIENSANGTVPLKCWFVNSIECQNAKEELGS